MKNVKEIVDFELINENNDLFSDDKILDKFLNIKNYNLNLYKEKIINVNEVNNINLLSSINTSFINYPINSINLFVSIPSPFLNQN